MSRSHTPRPTRPPPAPYAGPDNRLRQRSRRRIPIHPTFQVVVIRKSGHAIHYVRFDRCQADWQIPSCSHTFHTCSGARPAHAQNYLQGYLLLALRRLSSSELSRSLYRRRINSASRRFRCGCESVALAAHRVSLRGCGSRQLRTVFFNDSVRTAHRAEVLLPISPRSSHQIRYGRHQFVRSDN